MKVFKSLNRRTLNYTKNSVLIIGNLDGVHKGHQSIINSAKKIENIDKNLKDKKVVKQIFVKNKITNFITT